MAALRNNVGVPSGEGLPRSTPWPIFDKAVARFLAALHEHRRADARLYKLRGLGANLLEQMKATEAAEQDAREASAEIEDAVDEHAGEWRAELADSIESSREEYEAAIAALNATRNELLQLIALDRFLEAFPRDDFRPANADLPLNGLRNVLSNQTVLFGQVLAALREDARPPASKERRQLQGRGVVF